MPYIKNNAFMDLNAQIQKAVKTQKFYLSIRSMWFERIRI